jgi:DNA gyrase subunit A
MFLDASLRNSLKGSKTSKGRAIQNLINIEQDDKVKAFICTQNLKDEDYINAHYVIMAYQKRTGQENIFRAIF